MLAGTLMYEAPDDIRSDPDTLILYSLFDFSISLSLCAYAYAKGVTHAVR